MLLYLVKIKPFIDTNENRLNIVNEVLILIMFSLILVINLYETSKEITELVGYVMVILVAIDFLICWGFMIYGIIKSIVKVVRLRRKRNEEIRKKKEFEEKRKRKAKGNEEKVIKIMTERIKPNFTTSGKELDEKDANIPMNTQ